MRTFAAAVVAAALAAAGAGAFAAEPKDPYEVRENPDTVLADSETAPKLTLGTPLLRSATGWLLPGTGLEEKLPEFRITMDASAGALPGTLGDVERRVRGVEVMVPQSRGLWLGWEMPEEGTGEEPRATFSIRSKF